MNIFQGPMKALIFTFLYLCPLLAYAVDLEVSVNTSRTYSTISNGDRVEIGVEDNRSYCCQISLENHDSVDVSFNTPTVTSGTILNIATRGTTAPWVRDNDIGSAQATRQCFRYSEPNDDDDNGHARGLFVVNVPSGSPQNVIVKCDETTLFGGFNTVVTDYNYIEVTNTLANTDASSNVTVSISANGNISGNQVLNQTFELAAGQRFDVDVHSGAPNDFGPVVINHNGPKGAIRAVNVQYRVVNAATMDFEPVLHVPFVTRD